MTEANMFYIHGYNLFIRLNQSVDRIMNEDMRCKEIILTEKVVDCVKRIDSKMMELLLHKMTEDELSFYIQPLNSLKKVMERQEQNYD